MIYIDVDGVLADLESWMHSVDSEWQRAYWLDSDKVNHNFNRFVESVFLDSPETKYYDYLKSVYDQGNCKILTAVGTSWVGNNKSRAIQNKYMWLTSRGFNYDDLIIVDSGDDKIDYCKPNDILYDDRKKTIIKWNEAGGLGFMVPNPARDW